ncbi:MAG: HD domain-containing protein [Eubacterium sp.]|nr:HD domain-containing protein [Eubacterium sp.]
MEINRVKVIAFAVTQMLEEAAEEDRAAGYIHLFGVSQCAVLLAQKRGLDTELAAVCGLLHDYASYKTGESENHAENSANMSLPILAKTELFTPCEIGVIATAIAKHSDKDSVGESYEELLKDADVLQHALYNGGVSEKHAERYEKIKPELGI